MFLHFPPQCTAAILLRPSVFTQQNDYRQICLFSSVCLHKVQKRMSLLSFPHKDCSGFLSLRPYESYRLPPLMTVPQSQSVFFVVG